jgi:hypothetical protein
MRAIRRAGGSAGLYRPFSMEIIVFSLLSLLCSTVYTIACLPSRDRYPVFFLIIYYLSALLLFLFTFYVSFFYY